ncbi:MAG: hypothetical protein ACOZNI_21655 [Myxococcota bacterium]
MTLALLLVGCGEPRWSVTAALEPGFARMDTDGDGRVRAAEYERLDWEMPPFKEADADGDGLFELEEMVALIGKTDPQSVANTVKQQPTRPTRAPHEVPSRVGAAWMVAESLRREVLAVDPNAVVPTEEEMARIRTLQRLNDAPVRALLARIEAASDAAKVAFPKALRGPQEPPR